ncbi:Uncharacterised protein [Mycobacterium tuberculosis]|nr:Uncharacterised protein [Mycobacterium tuberculosis]
MIIYKGINPILYVLTFKEFHNVLKIGLVK